MSIQAVLAQALPLILLEAAILSAVFSQEETATVDYSNTTQTATNTTITPASDSSDSQATIWIVIVVVVLILIGGVLIAFFLKRRWQSQNLEKEKKMNMQMSSARNAGVYQDLTVSVPVDEKPPASPEHEKLNAAQDA